MARGTGDRSSKSLERKADAKEEIVNVTSGAREILDHSMANSRAVQHILLHPFNKEVRSEAVAKAREEKAVASQAQANIRAVGSQQAELQRMTARGQMTPGDYEQNFSGTADQTTLDTEPPPTSPGAPITS